jgi:assimilatory nitrate reductase electron transfer subunit
VRLADGELVAAELLVLATGTLPATALAASAGLPAERGVLVTGTLASPADSRVYAIGDCAQPPEGGSGLVAQGWEQARRLVAHLTGTARQASAPDTGDVVRLKAHGLDVVTMGVCGSAADDDPSRRRLLLSDPAAGRHVEVVVNNGRLVGARCIGAGPVAADLLATYTRRTPVPADPAYLVLPALVGTAPADVSVSADSTVCRCNGVTRGDIEAAVANGADTVEQVAAATRATSGCGGCRDDVCGLVTALARAQAPSTAVRTV